MKKRKITPYTIRNTFYIEVCNIFKTPMGLITDGTRYSAYEIELSANDSDADSLVFKISGDSPKLKWLVNENLLLMDGEYYIIKKISMEDRGEITYTIEAEHEICSYKEKMNGKIDMIGCNPEELITEVCTNTTELLPIRFGGTDIINKYRHLQSEEESIFSNLVTIAQRFNARLRFVNRGGIIYVWLLEKSVDKGRFIEKGRDLNSVNLEYDSSEMYTRLHYFGGTDKVTGNEITMHDENPTGKSYIEDFSYWTNQGYDLETVKANPNCIREMTIRNSELTTPKQVYEMALQEMSIICRPKLTVTVDLIDLQQMPVYKLEPIEIGDLIRVYDRVKNLNLEATVVGITKKSDNPLDISLSLSNVIEINSALKDLIGTSQVVDKITNGGNTVQGVFVQIGEKNLNMEIFEQRDNIAKNSAKIEANSKEIKLKVSEEKYTKEVGNIERRVLTAEQKITPDAIQNTVNENINNGKSIKGMSTELTKDYFRVRNTNNNSRVDITNGNIYTYDENGRDCIDIRKQTIQFYDFKNTPPKKIGMIESTFDLNNTSKWNIGIYDLIGNGSGSYLGHETSPGVTDKIVSAERENGIMLYDDVNALGRNFKCTKINQDNKARAIEIGLTTVDGNSVNGEYRTDGGGWLRLNLYRSVVVAVGNGSGNTTQYGTIRAGNFQTLNSIEISSKNSKIGSYSSQSTHETISDIGHGIIDESGECIIFFENDFLDFADTRTSYFVTYEVIGRNQKQIYTIEHTSRYFIVGGESGQEFTYRIECKKAGSNCERYFRNISQDHEIVNKGLDDIQGFRNEYEEKQSRDGILANIDNLRKIQEKHSYEQMKEIKESNKAMKIALELSELKRMEEN